jgi:hypothetical protein
MILVTPQSFNDMRPDFIIHPKSKNTFQGVRIPEIRILFTFRYNFKSIKFYFRTLNFNYVFFYGVRCSLMIRLLLLVPFPR